MKKSNITAVGYKTEADVVFKKSTLKLAFYTTS